MGLEAWKLKSDYFRIEIPCTLWVFDGFASAKIRLF